MEHDLGVNIRDRAREQAGLARLIEELAEFVAPPHIINTAGSQLAGATVPLLIEIAPASRAFATILDRTAGRFVGGADVACRVGGF